MKWYYYTITIESEKSITEHCGYCFTYAMQTAMDKISNFYHSPDMTAITDFHIKESIKGLDSRLLDLSQYSAFSEAIVEITDWIPE